MKVVTFHVDVLSPYAWLAFQRLPQALEGLSYCVEYRPVLLAAILTHWGQKGPAEIEPKRHWTFRQIAWWAQRDGLVIETPAVHPFNPLALLRLAWACTPAGGTPSRHVCEQLLRHVWEGGADATDAARLADLTARLAPLRDPAGADVKASLRDATDAAIAAGVFGVPSFSVDGRLFFGMDALDMLAASLRGDVWFDGPAWDAAGAPRPGVSRGG